MELLEPMANAVRVSVEFLGSFEFTFGAASMETTVPAPATVAGLLQALAAQCPAARALQRELSDDTSPRRPYYYVSVDYTVLPPDDVLNTPLHDGSRVCFAMPMVGG